jgi:hypothetical protein
MWRVWRRKGITGCRILMRKPNEKKSLGRSQHKSDNNTEMDLQAIE